MRETSTVDPDDQPAAVDSLFRRLVGFGVDQGAAKQNEVLLIDDEERA